MKKHLFLTLMLAALLCAALALCAFADDATLHDAFVTVDGQTILAASAKGETWFFLPSYADLHAVSLSFSAPEGAVVTVGETALRSGDAIDVAANVACDTDGVYALSYTVTPADGSPQTGRFCFMKSENIGAMFLSVSDPAFGRVWVESSPDHKNDAGDHTDIHMKMQAADATVVYDGKLTSLKGRGNTSWRTADKKPYQIKLDKKTDLLSSGDKANKNKTWILLANALDKTLFKNAFGLDLARYLGLKESPEYTYVNLYFDGEYRGLYQVTEKVQINSGRIDIAELEEHNDVADETATARAANRLGLAYQYNPTAVCDTDDISGGYLLELDNAFYGAENSWFKLYDGNIVVVKSPECCTREQMEYISVRFNEAVKAAQTDVCNSQSALELFDLDSLAALFMVNDYMKNIDFGYSSTFFFLPEEGNETYAHKFYAGPAWDFDTSLGNRESDYWRDPKGVYREGLTYFQGSLVRAYIKEKASAVGGLYDTVFSGAPAEQGCVRSFSGYRALLEPAIRMNFTIWPFDNTVNTFAEPDYDGNYTYARNFLQTRHNDIIPQIATWQTPAMADIQNCLNGAHTVFTQDKAPTCTEAGYQGTGCSVCGKVFSGQGALPALGHTDADNDKLCDRCGTYLGDGPSWLVPLLAFFARVLRFFRNLFNG